MEQDLCWEEGIWPGMGGQDLCLEKRGVNSAGGQYLCLEVAIWSGRKQDLCWERYFGPGGFICVGMGVGRTLPSGKKKQPLIYTLSRVPMFLS